MINARYENPAARLLAILTAGKEVPPSNNCRKTWSSLLGVEEGNETLLLSRLGKTMSLIGQAETEITRIKDVDPDRYLGWVEPAVTAFTKQNLNATWESFSNHINTHTLNYLSNTADILTAYYPRKSWNTDELERIGEGIDDVIEEVHASQLDLKAKEFMVAKLREIQIAIDEYKISGSGPLVEKIESTFGHAVLNPEFRDVAGSNPAARSFWMIIAKITMLSTLALVLLQIPNEIKDLLPDETVQFLEHENTEHDD